MCYLAYQQPQLCEFSSIFCELYHTLLCVAMEIIFIILRNIEDLMRRDPSLVKDHYNMDDTREYTKICLRKSVNYDITKPDNLK